MSKASEAINALKALKRAKEQGWSDDTYYHATRADIEEFKDMPGSDLGHHFARTPDAAMERLINTRDTLHVAGEGRATEIGENIIPVKLNIQNPIRLSDPGYWGGDVDSFINELLQKGVPVKKGMSKEQITKQIERQGYDGIIYENIKEGKGMDSMIALRPNQIRSINADFNPRKRKSGNILANVGAGLSTMGIVGAGMAPEDAEASFIGQAAKTFNKQALKRAEEMEAMGATRDEIWQETGEQFGAPMFRGPEGKWRQEISDEGFSEKPLYSDTDDAYTTSSDPSRWYDWREEAYEKGGLGIKRGYNLGEVGEAYPQFTGLKVNPKESDPMAGSYDRDRMITVASPKSLMGMNEADFAKYDSLQYGRSIPLHEVQHAIQQKEGFAHGGGIGQMAQELLEKKQQAEAIIRQANQQMSDNVRIRDRLEAEGATKERLKPYEDEYQDLIKMKMDVIDDAQIDPLMDAYNSYRRLAGEAEARNVQKRMDFPMYERVARPPWTTLDVPENELIVKTGGDLKKAQAISNYLNKPSVKNRTMQNRILRDKYAFNNRDIIEGPKRDVTAAAARFLNQYALPTPLNFILPDPGGLGSTLDKLSYGDISTGQASAEFGAEALPLALTQGMKKFKHAAIPAIERLRDYLQKEEDEIIVPEE